jgi:hypothetical protein
VYDNIREIEYVQTFDLASKHEKEVTGQAQCRSCCVRVADLVWHGGISEPRPRNNVELVAILVLTVSPNAEPPIMLGLTL